MVVVGVIGFIEPKFGFIALAILGLVEVATGGVR